MFSCALRRVPVGSALGRPRPKGQLLGRRTGKLILPLQCHHHHLSPPPLTWIPASPCSAWNKNLCFPGRGACGPPWTKTTCPHWWQPTRSWSTCGRTSPASSPRSSSACPLHTGPSTTTSAWRRARASETSSTVTLGTSPPWISDRASGARGLLGCPPRLCSPGAPCSRPCSQPDWKCLIYTSFLCLQRRIALGSGYCQEAEQARQGRILFVVYVCMHPIPSVCTRGEWCVGMCVCMYRGMKVNTSVRALKTRPGVSTCVHESVCVCGGGSNCTFGLLAPRAPQGPGWPPAPESCVLTRPGGEALACLLAGQQEHFCLSS